MRLFCRWKQNRLAREIYANQSAVSPVAITRHVIGCTDCRHAYDEMVRLHEELSQGFITPVVSEQFAQSVFEKIDARTVMPKGRQQVGNVLVFGGCAAILICVVFLWQSRQNPVFAPSSTLSSGVEKSLSEHSPLPAVRNHMPALPKVADKRSSIVAHREIKPKSVTRVVRKKRNEYVTSPSARKPYRRYRSLDWQPQIQPRTAFLSPEMQSQRLTQWANYYETHGDYSRAADAYAQAYDAVPAESTAFCAGQAAENAGDVSQAVLYYSQILRQPLKQKPQTEKGTRLWNSAHDAA